MSVKRFAAALAVSALAGLSATVVFAADEEKSAKPGALPRESKQHDHKSHQAPQERAAEPKSDRRARMSRSPAPASGSMPKGAAPSGKLGTEPTARGRLGTDPKPGESSDRPPRFN